MTRTLDYIGGDLETASMAITIPLLRALWPTMALAIALFALYYLRNCRSVD